MALGYRDHRNNHVSGILKKCPMCGELFRQQCSDQAWGYAYDGILVCSYHCMRAMEKREKAKEEAAEQKRAEDEKQYRKDYRMGMRRGRLVGVNPRIQARNEEIYRRYTEGETYTELMAAYGLKYSTIKNVIHKEKEMRMESEGKEDEEMENEEDRTKDVETTSSGVTSSALRAPSPKGEGLGDGAPAEKEADPEQLRARIRELETSLEEHRGLVREYFQQGTRLRELVRALYGLKNAWQERCELMEQQDSCQQRIDKYQGMLDGLTAEGGLVGALRGTAGATQGNG